MLAVIASTPASSSFFPSPVVTAFSAASVPAMSPTAQLALCNCRSKLANVPWSLPVVGPVTLGNSPAVGAKHTGAAVPIFLSGRIQPQNRLASLAPRSRCSALLAPVTCKCLMQRHLVISSRDRQFLVGPKKRGRWESGAHSAGQALLNSLMLTTSLAFPNARRGTLGDGDRRLLLRVYGRRL